MSYTEPDPKPNAGLTMTIERPRPAPPSSSPSNSSLPSARLATIEEPTPKRHQLLDNPIPADPANPFSPFFDHSEAPTTLSLQQETSNTSANAMGLAPTAPLMSKMNTSTSKMYDSDLEAQYSSEAKAALHTLITAKSGNSLQNSLQKNCTVWPGQKTLKDAKRREKRRGECWNPMRGLDKKTRFWLKVLIAAIIVGCAVGLGIGISKAVGGGIWKPEDH